MGVDVMDSIFWNLHQSRRIERNSREASEAQRDAGAARDAACDLEDTVERLALISRAMWNLMQRTTALGEDDLIAEVLTVDAADGAVDGRMRSTAMACPGCQRNNSRKRARCLYCGEELPNDSAFDRL